MPRLHPLIVALACCMGASAHAQLPTGFSPIRGGVSKRVDGREMYLNQAGERAIVNWKSFSIGAGNSVRITQPGKNSMMLNRVTGASPSDIAGSLTANGRVFLVNPNGILFGAGARVSTGGLIASALDISDDDFAAGRLHFAHRALGDAAEVVNQGVLTAGAGGTLALLGGVARNEGAMRADGGTVALAAARHITVDFAGDGLTTFRLDPHDQAAQALAENARGAVLQADGGRVVVAADASALAQRVVNVEGIIRARTLAAGRDGEILLQAGAANQLTLDGTLDATGASARRGGRIAVEAGGIEMGARTVADASGDAGGGRIDVHARHGAVLQPASTLRANATHGGAGGTVDVQGGDSLRARGVLQAYGAGQGQGGFVETSARVVDLAGISVDTHGAGAGAAGTWLIDPYDITVEHGQSTPGAPGLGAPFDPAAASVIYDDDISRALNSGNNVVIQTGALGEGALDEGAIFINGDVSITQDTGTAHRTLRFDAHREIGSEQFSIKATSGALDVIFNTNAHDTQKNDASIYLGSATIHTNGGDVMLAGQSDQASGWAFADDRVAVRLSDSTIDTRDMAGMGGGAVTIRGQSLISHGEGAVRIEGSQITTAGGDISISGVTPRDRIGVLLEGTPDSGASSLTSGSGNIFVYGSAGQTDGFGPGYGVILDTGTQMRTESGNIDIRGRATASASDSADHRGVTLLSGSGVVSASGDVSISGEVAAGAAGYGIDMGGGRVRIEGGRSVTLRASASNEDWEAIMLSDAELHSAGQVNFRPGGVTAAGALRDDTAKPIQLGTLSSSTPLAFSNFMISQAILDAVRAPAVVLGGDTHAGPIRVVGDVAFLPQGISGASLTLQAEGAGGGIEVEQGLDVHAGTVGLLADGDIVAAGPGLLQASRLLARSNHGGVTLISVAGGADELSLAGAAATDFVVDTAARIRLDSVQAPGVDIASGNAQPASATGRTAGVAAVNVQLLGGAVEQAAGADIQADTLRAEADGSLSGDVMLDNPGNQVGLAAGRATGEFRYTNAGALTIGTAGGAQGIQADQVRVRTLAGDLTLAAALRARRAVLVAASRFQNPAGATALDVGEAWQIWADTWRGETRGGLAGVGDHPNLYGCAYEGTCVPDAALSASPDDDHFIYREQPVLRVTPDDQQIIEGDTIPPLSYAVDGWILGDTPDSLSGSLGTNAAVGSPPGDYPISGAFSSSAGYDVQVGTGTLTVQAPPTPPDPPDPPKPPTPPTPTPPDSPTPAQTALTIPAVPWERVPPSTWLYDRNLSAAPVCVAQDLRIETHGQQGDVLAREWSLLRARPNLMSCVSTDRSNACADF